MKVNISPGVGIIKIFKALDYESWYALAEFIDNSISSFLLTADTIKQTSNSYTLGIDIQLNFEDDTITVYDNAGGIPLDKFEYAFRAAEIPDDNTGLNEFGMGMKTASSWLANKWTIETSAFGESVTRTIEFNVNDVVANDKHELEVQESHSDPIQHFTRITLEELTGNAPQKRDLHKIRKHLSSIHRKFIQRDDITIKVNNEKLTYNRPAILSAPRWDNEEGEPIKWIKEIDLKFGENKSVQGFVALLNTMSTSVYNGFSLFRRGRVIEGSGEDLFRPKELNGGAGTHQYKRVFGELELKGFKVDFKKGKFIGDADFELLFKLLQNDCDKDDFPLLRQARLYRKPQPRQTLESLADKGISDYRQSIPKRAVRESVASIISSTNEDEQEPSQISAPYVLETITEEFDIEFQHFKVSLTLTDSPAIQDWLSLNDRTQDGNLTKVEASLQLNHPFMQNFGSDDLQPFIRVAMALLIAETLAAYIKSTPAIVRRNFNKVLKSISK